MRKAVLMLLLCVVSGSAAAGWIEVDSDETTTFFIDPATIRRDGNLVKMWELLDFKKARLHDKVKYMSSKTQSEYDCKEERLRKISSTFHSEKMARGKTVSIASNPGKWEPVPPGGGIEALWKIACGKGHC